MDPSLPVQHLAGAPDIQPWQVINLVGGPIAAIMLLPKVIDDLNHWWSSRVAQRIDSEERHRRR